jgi:hypothetical protein
VENSACRNTEVDKPQGEEEEEEEEGKKKKEDL